MLSSQVKQKSSKSFDPFGEDLAERVDDLFCEILGGVGDPDMDAISMLVTGWIILLIIAVALIKYAYLRFYKSKYSSQYNLVGTNSNDKEYPVETIIEEEAIVVNKYINNTQTEGIHYRKTASTTSYPRSDCFNLQEPPSSDYKGPCTGPDPIVVNYINQCYDWIYFQHSDKEDSFNDLNDQIIESLNRALRENNRNSHFSVNVTSLELKDVIELSNIFAECVHANNVRVTADCELKSKGQLSVSSKDFGVKRVDFFVDKLSGRINTLIDCEENVAVVKLDGWPEICVSISNSPKKTIEGFDATTSAQIADSITAAVRNIVLEIECNNLKNFPLPLKVEPLQLDGAESRKYLLVKVLRGTDIGLMKNCEEPYCAVELDDPPQKFQTSAVSSDMKNNPVWNENFVFNVIPGIGEMLFEVYDVVGSKFLGCNIVSVDETGEGKTKILPLKSRRMEISETITGTVEVQYTFIDEKEFLQKSEEAEQNALLKEMNSKPLMTTTHAVFTRPPEVNPEVFTENVIKEFEKSVMPNAKRSTLIIHGVQREPTSPSDTRCVVKIKMNSDGLYDVLESPVPSKPDKESIVSMEHQYGEERGRSKTRKGDIFTSIKRRFSRGVKRSKSALPGEELDGVMISSDHDEPFTRSISADRPVGFGGRGLHLSNSTRSSASELSAISGQSSSTFIHENSTLVIECMENKIKTYYLVPPHLAATGKWKKKGRKLHIYNDHTFVAKHIPSGTLCQVCSSRLTFSFGKQGYQCRDCKMICHKECHVRVPSFCPTTTVYDIELKKDPTGNQGCTNKSKWSLNRSSSSASNSSSVSSKDGVYTKPRKKKRLNILRKVTRLGKISEENLTAMSESSTQLRISSEKLSNGDILLEKELETYTSSKKLSLVEDGRMKKIIEEEGVEA